MKNLLGVVVMAVLVFFALGCGSDAKPGNGACAPACDGKNCGDSDGCGGKCAGTCPADMECNAQTFVCAARTCTAPKSYGSLATITGTAATDDVSVPTSILFFSEINADALPDALSIQLMTGKGVFAGGLKTGTFQLTGGELNYETCAACVLLNSDIDYAVGKTTAIYMATGGTLTLAAVSGRLMGSLSNATFEHVTLDSNTFRTTPVGDGCTTAITSVAFDAILERVQ